MSDMVEIVARAIFEIEKPEFALADGMISTYRSSSSVYANFSPAWLAYQAAARAAIEAMGKWQPIDTAPKDGSSVLIAHWFVGSRDYRIAIARWDEPHELWLSDIYPFSHWTPTCWMPLPEPPK